MANPPLVNGHQRATDHTFTAAVPRYNEVTAVSARSEDGTSMLGAEPNLAARRAARLECSTCALGIDRVIRQQAPRRRSGQRFSRGEAAGRGSDAFLDGAAGQLDFRRQPRRRLLNRRPTQ